MTRVRSARPRRPVPRARAGTAHLIVLDLARDPLGTGDYRDSDRGRRRVLGHVTRASAHTRSAQAAILGGIGSVEIARSTGSDRSAVSEASASPPLLRQAGRVDPQSEATQFLSGLCELLLRLRGPLARHSRCRPACCAQGFSQPSGLALRTLVEPTLQAPAFLVPWLEDPLARRPDLGLAGSSTTAGGSEPTASCSATESPSTPGSWVASSTTPGRRRATASIARLPSGASPTTSKPSALSGRSPSAGSPRGRRL